MSDEKATEFWRPERYYVAELLFDKGTPHEAGYIKLCRTQETASNFIVEKVMEYVDTGEPFSVEHSASFLPLED